MTSWAYWAAFAVACVVFAGALVLSWDARRQARRKAERVAHKMAQMPKWDADWASLGSGSER